MSAPLGPERVEEIRQFLSSVRGGGGGYSDEIIATLCDISDALLTDHARLVQLRDNSRAIIDRERGQTFSDSTDWRVEYGRLLASLTAAASSVA